MSWIDYGALVKKNGKLLSYEEASKDSIYGYAKIGDEEFGIDFARRSFVIIENGKQTYEFWCGFFDREERYTSHGTLKVKHLDCEIYFNEDLLKWDRPWYFIWYITDASSSKEYLHAMHRYYKRIARLKRSKNNALHYKYKTPRWIFEWDYNGDHYEVLFGSGIDPDKEVWEKIKPNRFNDNPYSFSDYEVKILEEEWYGEMD